MLAYFGKKWYVQPESFRNVDEISRKASKNVLVMTIFNKCVGSVFLKSFSTSVAQSFQLSLSFSLIPSIVRLFLLERSSKSTNLLWTYSGSNCHSYISRMSYIFLLVKLFLQEVQCFCKTHRDVTVISLSGISVKHLLQILLVKESPHVIGEDARGGTFLCLLSCESVET